MKPEARRLVVTAVCALLQGLRAKGQLLALMPLGRLLRGIYLEDSSDPLRIYVWAFVQPLYTPASTVVFDFGKRLGGGSRTWTVTEPAAIAAVARDEGVPFISSIESPEDFANWEVTRSRPDLYAREAVAYSLVACARFDEGVQALRELARSLLGGTATAWMMEMQSRAELLADAVEKRPEAGHALLAKWESETVNALGLHDLA
jgi:hypothetical protein